MAEIRPVTFFMRPSNENARFGTFRIGSEMLFPSPHGNFQMRRENGQFFGSQFEKEIQIPIGLQDF
jgi:hypothetical protein